MSIDLTTILAGEEEPMQPVGLDPFGTHRFLENRIVTDLLKTSECMNMNTIAEAALDGDYSDAERRQFAQLIGYSVDGYSSLSYVNDASYERAGRLSDQLLEDSKEP